VYYIQRLKSFRKSKEEAKIYRILTLFRTTAPYYFILFLISSMTYLLGLKLDAYISWPWYFVFGPVWIFDFILVMLLLCLLYFWIDRSQELRSAIQRTFPLALNPIASGIIVSIVISVLLFTALLSSKLDNILIVGSWSWWVIHSPFIYLCVLATAAPITLLIKRGWVWSCFWAIFLVVSFDLTILLSIAKLENQISGDWCLIFLPWWISDVFALVCAVSLCMELHSSRLGWCVTILYSSYMSSIITFRSLLCVNLGTVCSDPVAYSYNLIFIALHVFIFIFGLPVIIFMRRRWEIKQVSS